MTATDTTEWRVSKAGGTRMGHSWLTTAPGCPDDRHPTRWCRCAVHTSEAAAWQYIDDQETTP